ncbi:LodA/GoxA family CTQ-dependent oxidase [Xanthobacter aminoxidans]|uniref:LodA/GoxA family CTQ-dependent oxidase n=1 Tax=Xanthobacter aminoxidans TaxID=186280 RepID=UPI00372CF47A
MGDGVLSRRAFVAGLSAGVTGATLASAASGGIDPKRVARIAIHPAIGVARVGNSKDAFHFCPEVPGAVPVGPFKDEGPALWPSRPCASASSPMTRRAAWWAR